MADFVKLNGYDVKDKISRENISNINTQISNINDEISNLPLTNDFIISNLFANTSGNPNNFFASINGYDFTQINFPIDVAGRDVVFRYDKYRKLFYLVFGSTSQEYDFVLKVSADLENWETYNINIGLTSFANRWAFTIFPLEDRLLLHVSCASNITDIVNIYGDTTGLFKLYKAECVDFENFIFSNASQIQLTSLDDTQANHNIYIDSSVAKLDDTYYMVIKNEYYARIQLFTSTDLSNWTCINDNIFKGNYPCEAPEIIFNDNYCYIYAEDYKRAFMFMASCMMVGFPNFDFSLRRLYSLRGKHGSFNLIDDAHAKNIILEKCKLNFLYTNSLRPHRPELFRIDDSTNTHMLSNLVPLPNNIYVVYLTTQNNYISIYNMYDLDYMDLAFYNRADCTITIQQIDGTTRNLLIENSANRNERLIRIPLKNVGGYKFIY